MRFSEHFPAVAQGGWKPPVSASSLADNNGCRFGRGEIQQPSSSSGVTTGVAEDSPASTEVQTAAESESSKPLAALPVSSLVGALVPLPVRTGRLLHAPQPRIDSAADTAAGSTVASGAAILQPTTSAVLIDYWQGRSAAGSGDVGGGATPSSSLGASAELSTGSVSGVPFVKLAKLGIPLRQ
ncbi:hypothetical protein cyc_09049 [Cyclospora cayetanensis]|uniref:Uncharacterized protein n=1 Tax=Cyclospora cayetanensis TaxID=88456 RepID=A0A1D3D3T7_9EIME|nr:hypothetical protein cyc_09049 [Cyclospora cayetanensis]